MKLIEDHGSLGAACRAIEAATAADERLRELIVQVRLISLADLPENSSTDVFRDGGAAYRRSTREILIDPSLVSRGEDVLTAIVAHEAGHAVAHAFNEKWDPSGREDQTGEEFIADRYTCAWGFFDGLAAERIDSYGQRYVDCLRTWPALETYRSKMELWRILKNANVHR